MQRRRHGWPWSHNFWRNALRRLRLQHLGRPARKRVAGIFSRREVKLILTAKETSYCRLRGCARILIIRSIGKNCRCLQAGSSDHIVVAAEPLHLKSAAIRQNQRSSALRFWLEPAMNLGAENKLG